MHSLSTKEVLKKLHSSEKGLSKDIAKKMLSENGPNILPKSDNGMTKFKIFFEQWTSPLILILVVAGIASGILGEFIDMTVIGITVGVNVLVGFVQENKADNALKKLYFLITYKAMVLRNGEKHLIPSEDIVVGDILLLDAGDKVQADGRIIENIDFTVNESILTGESEPVEKQKEKIKQEAGIGDRTNMVFRGTTITNGRARVVVTAVGEKTELGNIARLVKQTSDDKTPLQQQLTKLSKMIAIVVLFISVAIFFLGVFGTSEKHTFLEMFGTSVAVAVAAIPEGLVISLTIILAVGMQFILKKKALVRKLVAAETLGSVSVICTDKTGTLTEGNMSITSLITAENNLDHDELKVIHIEKEDHHPDALLAFKIGILCNNAITQEMTDKEIFVGDTTDIAFARVGLDIGIKKQEFEKIVPRKGELPFDSIKKYMATLHHIDGKEIIYVKGAPEVIFKKATHYYKNGKVWKLNEKQKKFFEEHLNTFVEKGLRAIAVGFSKKQNSNSELNQKDVNDVVLVGLFALSDPLRSDVKSTIDIAKKAGIRIVMITGDHVKTAQSIAREINLPAEDENIFDGEMLGKINNDELEQAVKHISVFARVNPEDKIRIVQAFQRNDEVVAMTGDGVNDAPAIKGADIGIALGSGTDVAKETADIVLEDDRLGTIVDAVEEGRGIYQNIKKIVLYLLSGSFAEVILIAGSLIGGLPLAILPAQILWVNLIEDSFPNMALAFDKGDKENMKEPPRKRDDSILDKEMKTMIAIISIVSNIVLFGLFLYFWRITGDIDLTRTIMFVGLGIDSLLYIYSVRSMRRHIWNMNPFNNKYLTASIAFGWAMLLGAVYLPHLQYLLRTIALGWQHWGIMLLFGLLNVMLIEIVKGIFLVRKSSTT
ncbi:MAG: ATPase [Candidatus Magasanikbacteria bacterium CG_4_10_14_0_2_um_filter_37_12]|uniref:ATPase n=1 Tax=Candidatus Magasanikbacteria bacterium CG_4_10_14_0_2_um_filter_37_12 TaxID=1974637 RepID=A0A2M7V6R2_9BACT|nr:MAG: ATPase [Candidatus Magasanikbacteria bacterium CG_4_10_14_0_2_um_filter_37_12]